MTATFRHAQYIIRMFIVPILILSGILVTLVLKFILHVQTIATIVILTTIFIGSLELIQDTIASLLKRKFALDYIALLAITVGVVSQQYIVAGIIVLMLAGGNTLEKYGMDQAKASLTALTDRIPNTITLWANERIGSTTKIESVTVGQEIVVRKGEVIPLDGNLISQDGLIDESSLTGEPYVMEKTKGDIIRSGTINVGNLIVIQVTKSDTDSTYRKIINMVVAAQQEKAPLIRLADRYSSIFTIITLTIAAAAYLMSHDLYRVLSVLVIATPCPLILATPIALMGGMNAAAKRRIIMKTLAGLEVLSRVNTIVFDKTGTITVGKPVVQHLSVFAKQYPESDIYAIAAAIERNSLHPLAKAIVHAAHKHKAPKLHAQTVEETIGTGISAVVNGVRYHLAKVKNHEGMAIELKTDSEQIAIFTFEDEMKKESKEIVNRLRQLGLKMYLFTGDKQVAADRVAKQLGSYVIVKAECSPEDKKNGIERLKQQGNITAMVGDGINDAPALALADIGMVFSNDEHTASTEAADVVFLGGDFTSVIHVISISKQTVRIALESILFGIGLSICGMIAAAFGFLPAIVGAFLQEAIDIAVIFNALRASRYTDLS